jgi:hypothetical protein
MRYLLFLLLPYVAMSQEVVSDTAYIETRDSTFWAVRITNYASGQRTTTESPLGSDTAQVVNSVLSTIYPIANGYASNAAKVITGYAPTRQAVGATNSTLMGLIGKNYFAVMSEQIGDEFLGEYTMRVSGAPVDASIIRLPSGLLRYRQGGTNFGMVVLARNWIRILRYNGTSTQTTDTSVFVDLFLDEQRKVFIECTNGLNVTTYLLRRKNLTR